MIHPPNNTTMESASTMECVSSFDECEFTLFDGDVKVTQQQNVDTERLDSHFKSTLYAPCNFKGCCRVYKGVAAYRNLFRHQQANHEGEIYHCHFCNKGFYTSRDLTYHQDQHCIAVHTFLCTICQRQYLDLKHFNYHNQTHEHYPCSQCPMICHTINAITNHTKSHQHPMMRTYYKCIHCPSQYLTMNNLNKHVKNKH